MESSSIHSSEHKTIVGKNSQDNSLELESGQAHTVTVRNGGVGDTQRKLSARHVTFLGLGSGIGTGLLVGTGSALASSGPLGLLLAFSITGLILWAVMISIGELCTLIPTAGSFPYLSSRFIDPSVGFTLAITYWYTYASSIAAELSAAALLVGFWSDISPALVISLGYAAIVFINFLPVRFFGEAEVITSSLKVILFVGLIILGVIIDLGGAPSHDRIGFRLWTGDLFAPVEGFSKGALSNFLAFFSALITASYAYQGVECIALAAGETASPSTVLPKAIKRVVYRIAFFYVAGVFVICTLVPYTDPRLTENSGSAQSSPFVIAIQRAGIPVLPSIVNAVIISAALSAGNSFLYVSSRTLLAMSIDGSAPTIFSRVTKRGVPIYAVGLSSTLGALAYLSLSTGGGASQTFYWLLNMSTIGGLCCWMTLCFAFIRYHKACRVQGLDRNTLAYRSPFQPYAAWFGFISCLIVIFFAGYRVFLSGNWNTSDFFASYVGIPLYVVPLVFWKLFKRTKFQRAANIDLDSGRMNSEDEVQEPIPTTRWGKFLAWLF